MSENRKPKPLSEGEIQQIIDALKSISTVLNTMLSTEEEIEIDKDSMNALIQLMRQLHVISQALDDTIQFHHHQAYTGALEFYENVKKAAEMKIPGAEAIFNDLSSSLAEAQRKQSKSFWTPKHDN